MKIFLCGQRTFGKEVCRALLAAGHEIVGVAPAPPQKRKDKLHGFAAVQGLPLVTDCQEPGVQLYPGWDGADRGRTLALADFRSVPVQGPIWRDRVSPVPVAPAPGERRRPLGGPHGGLCLWWDRVSADR